MTSESSSALMEFQMWALSTSSWAQHALYLRNSAELLWQPLERMFDIYLATAKAGTAPKDQPGFDAEAGRHAHAYLLVAGCALEAMLKAAAIQRALNKQGPSGVLTPDGKQFQGWLTNHELGPLAKRAAVTLSTAHSIYLGRFRDYIVWAGRYPTPKKFQEPTDDIKFNYQSSSNDRLMFDVFFKMAHEAYERAVAIRKGRVN